MVNVRSIADTWQRKSSIKAQMVETGHWGEMNDLRAAKKSAGTPARVAFAEAYSELIEKYGLPVVDDVPATRRGAKLLAEVAGDNDDPDRPGVKATRGKLPVEPGVSPEVMARLGATAGSAGWMDGADVAKAIDWAWGNVLERNVDEETAPNVGAVFLGRIVRRSDEDREWFLREFVLPRAKASVAGHDERRRRDDGRDLTDRLKRLEAMLSDDDVVPVKGA